MKGEALCLIGSMKMIWVGKGSNYLFGLKVIKSNILNIKGLANEDEKSSVQIDFLENIEICLYLNLFPGPI